MASVNSIMKICYTHVLVGNAVITQLPPGFHSPCPNAKPYDYWAQWRRGDKSYDEVHYRVPQTKWAKSQLCKMPSEPSFKQVEQSNVKLEIFGDFVSKGHSAAWNAASRLQNRGDSPSMTEDSEDSDDL